MSERLFLFCMFLILVASTAVSCKKEVIDKYELRPPSSKSLILNTDAQGDSRRVLLQWSKYNGKSFKHYSINRMARVIEDGNLVEKTSNIATLEDVNDVEYEDDLPPNAVWARYNIVATEAESGTSVLSNFSQVNLDGPYFGFPGLEQVEVLIDIEAKLLYFVQLGSGVVSTVSYVDNRLVARDSIRRRLVPGTLAPPSGQQPKALYVPTEDGWLYVLDPATLAIQKRLFLEELGISSVIASGSTFIAATHRGNYGGKIKVYDRTTNNLIDESAYYSYVSLFKFTEYPRTFFSITSVPAQLARFALTDDDKITSISEDNYNGDHPLRSEIVVVAPNGSRFVTTGQGAIYNNSLVHEQTLAPYSYFDPAYQHYAFNDDGSVLYAASADEFKIEQIPLPGKEVAATFYTSGHPYRLFKDGEHLVVVNMAQMLYTSPSDFYLSVEIIEL